MSRKTFVTSVARADDVTLAVSEASKAERVPMPDVRVTTCIPDDVIYVVDMDMVARPISMPFTWDAVGGAPTTEGTQ